MDVGGFGVYFNIICLNGVHCLRNNDSAARLLIAWGLGAYIRTRENFEKIEQDTGDLVYILN